MRPPLSKDTVEKIRKEVKKGRPRYKVATKFGVTPKTVYNYTDGLPKKHLSPAKKAWIKRKAKEGKSKYQISKELDVSYSTVWRIAKDFPSYRPGWPGIRGKPLEMLQEFLEKGYVLLDGEKSQAYRVLKKNLPVIQKVRANGKPIAFLPYKKEDATRALLQSIDKKVMSYQELRSITKLFDVELPRDEKKGFIGKFKNKKGGSARDLEGDSSLEKSDSLVDFYMRNY